MPNTKEEKEIQMKLNSKNTCKTALFGALLAASLLGGVNAAQAAIAISFDMKSDEYQDPNATNNNIVGWSFTANRDLYATRLAVYDTDRDITPESSHFIGLWNSTGSLLASTTIFESSNTRQGVYHWATIAQTTLKQGQTYYVGAVMGKDYYTAYVPESLGFGYGAPTAFGNLQVNSGITFNADAFYYLGNGESANQITFGSASRTTGLNGAETVIGGFGANIDVTPTPIPAAAWLLGSGLLGLIGLRRRNG
jgi:hypothetical protein